jgi:alpha-L-rhamnosidase
MAKRIQGAIDSITDAANRDEPIQQFSVLRVSGWAADSCQGTPLPLVRVDLDGVPRESAFLGVLRPDIASAFFRPNWLKSGWSAWIDIGGLDPGNHTVSVTAATKDAISAVIGSRLFRVNATANLPPLDPVPIQTVPPHLHQPLPEQYVWFGGAFPDSSSPRFFRRTFTLESVPDQATLYLIGPYSYTLFVNATRISQHVNSPALIAELPVAISNIRANLHPGQNTLAVQGSDGDAFALKIVPASQGIDAPPLLISDENWKASTTAPPGWEELEFDDSSWSAAQSLGSLEADFHRFQGNRDLEMYQWPGYEGIASLLDHAPLSATVVRDLSPNGGNFSNVSQLLSATDNQNFQITLPPNGGQAAANLTLDFGKEVAGRLEVASASGQTIHLQLVFGESAEEATDSESYLGPRELIIPPFTTVHGPHTAFRFVNIRFIGGPQVQTFAHIRADQEFRNYAYLGSFHSSDPVIDRIWNVSAYSAHLAMQATYWDAPKRDRNPFSGDLYVAARTARVVFGHTMIVGDTLTELLTHTSGDINGIPGYNAYWVLALADEFNFSGDLTLLQSNRIQLVQTLNLMASELNGNLFSSSVTHPFVFADWSPGMVQLGAIQAPEAVKITTMIYYRAFLEGATILQKLGDSTLSTTYEQTAASIKTAVMAAYADASTGTFGERMQTNAMAIFSGIADSIMSPTIFSRVLSKPPALPITPYFNYFVLSAMAQTGHRAEALSLMREYWGGMLNLGATTFWEFFDPNVPALHFHAGLTSIFNSIDDQGTRRDFVSLAHAWASGPASWLHEEVLGIKPLSAGFRTILIRPDLAGLEFASGTQPTPNGAVSVDIHAGGHLVKLDLPSSADAFVSLPTLTANPVVLVNGVPTVGTLSEGKARAIIHLPQSAVPHYFLRSF